MKFLFTFEETERQIIIIYNYLWVFVVLQISGGLIIVFGSHILFLLAFGVFYLTIGLVGIIPYFVHTTVYKKKGFKIEMSGHQLSIRNPLKLTITKF
ncbi:MAG: hypothetical protein KJ666_12445 [Bacteroidetes bacterium]|nr:hypothetical protein [Bacteroidota bacterium]MBU2584142.1 hypothetical protein [Bacteroidota bacterium]